MASENEVHRDSFLSFKSAFCHELMWHGDIDFIKARLEKNEIRTFYDRGWYPEAFYLLAMVDYLSKLNDVPLCHDYDDIRHYKLSETLWVGSIELLCMVFNSDEPKEKALKECIPEFLRYNIVETDIRNVG